MHRTDVERRGTFECFLSCWTNIVNSWMHASLYHLLLRTKKNDLLFVFPVRNHTRHCRLTLKRSGTIELELIFVFWASSLFLNVFVFVNGQEAPTSLKPDTTLTLTHRHIERRKIAALRQMLVSPRCISLWLLPIYNWTELVDADVVGNRQYRQATRHCKSARECLLQNKRWGGTSTLPF